MAGFSGLVADLPAVITNVSLVIVFAGAVTAGAIQGAKQVKEFLKPAAAVEHADEKSQIAAVTILENVTLNEWTRSNKEVAVAAARLCDMLGKTLDEVSDLRRTVEDIQHQLKRGER